MRLPGKAWNGVPMRRGRKIILAAAVAVSAADVALGNQRRVLMQVLQIVIGDAAIHHDQAQEKADAKIQPTLRS